MIWGNHHFVIAPLPIPATGRASADLVKASTKSLRISHCQGRLVKRIMHVFPATRSPPKRCCSASKLYASFVVNILEETLRMSMDQYKSGISHPWIATAATPAQFQRRTGGAMGYQISFWDLGTEGMKFVDNQTVMHPLCNFCAISSVGFVN